MSVEQTREKNEQLSLEAMKRRAMARFDSAEADPGAEASALCMGLLGSAAAAAATVAC